MTDMDPASRVEGNKATVRRMLERLSRGDIRGFTDHLALNYVRHWQAMPPELQELRRLTHQALQKVTDDMGRRRTFNTAIAAVMELTNALGKSSDGSERARAVRHEALEIIVRVLSPIVPHITHALWFALGHEDAAVDAPWPRVDSDALIQDSLEIVVQVNGKLRGRVSVPAQAGEERVREIALADETVARHVGGKPVKKVIVVPGKLVNIVVAG